MESLLTESQLSQLTRYGEMIEEYWREFCPKMYKELYQKKQLFPILKQKGKAIDTEMMDMARTGVHEDAAMEIIREEIYSPKPEKTEEDGEE